MKKVLVGLLILATLAAPVITGRIYPCGDPWDVLMPIISLDK